MDFENYVLLGLAGTLSSRRRAVQCWQWVTAVGGAVTAPPVTDPSRQKGNIGCSELPRRMLVAQATVKEQKTKENWLLHSSEAWRRDLQMQKHSWVPELSATGNFVMFMASLVPHDTIRVPKAYLQVQKWKNLEWILIIRDIRGFTWMQAIILILGSNMMTANKRTNSTCFPLKHCIIPCAARGSCSKELHRQIMHEPSIKDLSGSPRLKNPKLSFLLRNRYLD